MKRCQRGKNILIGIGRINSRFVVFLVRFGHGMKIKKSRKKKFDFVYVVVSEGRVCATISGLKVPTRPPEGGPKRPHERPHKYNVLNNRDRFQ